MSNHEGQPIEGQGIEFGILTPEQILLRKEILGGEIAAIIIGGASGTGKTKLAEAVIMALGIPEEDYYLVGQGTRSDTGAGQKAQGFMERPITQDRNVDQEQIEMILRASPGKPVVIESHLGPFLRNVARQQNPNLPPMITLEPTAPKRVRMRWIRDRSIKDQQEEIARLEEKLEKLLHPDSPDAPLAEPEVIELLYTKLQDEQAKHFSITSVTKDESEREARDNARFQTIHPWAVGIKHLHSPEIVDGSGQRIYDIVIPVADLKLEEVPGVVLERIIGYRRALEAEKYRPVLIEDDFPRAGDARVIEQALRNQPH
jgi:cytidylate kinase